MVGLLCSRRGRVRAWMMRRRWIGTGFVLAVLAGGTVAAVRLAQPDPTLRTFGVGAFPYAVAVNAAGRAFVVNRTSYWATGPSGLGSASNANRVIVPSFGRVAVAALGGRVFVGSGQAVTVLDARSGRVLRTVRVAEVVRHLAVDPQTGHIFIAGDTAV